MTVNSFTVKELQRLLQQKDEDETLHRNYSCADPFIETVERVARILYIVSRAAS